MDAGWFLKERTRFIRQFYDEGVRPFRSTMLSIENQIPPFVPPPFDPDNEACEPPYQAQWNDAATAVELVGRSCVMILSETLKNYFQTLQNLVIGFTVTGTDGERKAFWKGGFLAGYKLALGEVFATDWSDCPADFDIIEQVVLARNRSAHGNSLTSLSIQHDARTLEKYPKPFFASEWEVGAWDGELHGHAFLWANLSVGRDTLFEAIEHIELLCDWIDENEYRIADWASGLSRFQSEEFERHRDLGRVSVVHAAHRPARPLPG